MMTSICLLCTQWVPAKFLEEPVTDPAIIASTDAKSFFKKNNNFCIVCVVSLIGSSQFEHSLAASIEAVVAVSDVGYSRNLAGGSTMNNATSAYGE